MSEFAAPNAMRYRVIGGLEGVFIGEDRFTNEGGAWRQSQLVDTSFKFPNFAFTDKADSVVFGPREVVDGVQTQAVVFILKSAGANARYAAWIDEKSNRIIREAMIASGHYMLTRNYDFNAAVKITTPPLR